MNRMTVACAVYNDQDKMPGTKLVTAFNNPGLVIDIDLAWGKGNFAA